MPAFPDHRAYHVTFDYVRTVSDGPSRNWEETRVGTGSATLLTEQPIRTPGDLDAAFDEQVLPLLGEDGAAAILSWTEFPPPADPVNGYPPAAPPRFVDKPGWGK